MDQKHEGLFEFLIIIRLNQMKVPMYWEYWQDMSHRSIKTRPPSRTYTTRRSKKIKYLTEFLKNLRKEESYKSMMSLKSLKISKNLWQKEILLWNKMSHKSKNLSMFADISTTWSKTCKNQRNRKLTDKFPIWSNNRKMKLPTWPNSRKLQWKKL